jgi:hypothetical protein
MESLLYPELLNIIYTFLDKKSLIKYDTANTNKKNRVNMLYTFQNYYNYQIGTCMWTIIRGIKFISQTCKIKYIKYVSPVCKYLTIHGKGEINVYNDNIESLYIDMHLNNYVIKDILCKNLKKMTIVLANNNQINLEIFKYLHYKCPNIEKIILMMDESNINISELIKNKNINILRLKTLKLFKHL